MSDKYPFISYPEGIKEYLDGEIPELKPNTAFPNYAKDKFNYQFLFLGILCMVIALLTIKFKIVISILSFFLALFFIFGFVGEYQTVVKRNKANIDKYTADLKFYNEKEKKRELLLGQLITHENRKKYIKSRILEISQSATDPQENIGNYYSIGKAEYFFYHVLKTVFQDSIKVNVTIPNIEGALEYLPDFAFIDRDIKIDIEIDEPYIYKTLAPIHFYEEGGHVDSYRNSFFNSHNWYVIRFAEEQIVNTPYECCKTIADLINKVAGNSYYSKVLTKYKFPTPINFWNKAESAAMADGLYRNTYLKNPTFILRSVSAYNKDLIPTTTLKCIDCTKYKNGYLLKLMDSNSIIHLLEVEQPCSIGFVGTLMLENFILKKVIVDNVECLWIELK